MKNTNRTSKSILVLAAALLSAAICDAASYKSAARTFARAAQRAGVERVAVLPLNGSAAAEGRFQAGRIAAALAGRRGIRVVERGALGSVLNEQRLGLTGALDASRLARVGRLLQAQAVVTGDFAAVAGDVEITVRLIMVETGEVLAARRFDARRRYFEEVAAAIPEPRGFGAMEAVADVYSHQTGKSLPESAVARRPAADEFRDAPRAWDAPAAPRCSDAAERVDAMQAEILDLKARYWAGKLGKRGFKASSVAQKPGAVISDPALRERFFQAMKEAYTGRRTKMSIAEIRRFLDADRASFELFSQCRAQIDAMRDASNWLSSAR